jgi:hypothetical protein
MQRLLPLICASILLTPQSSAAAPDFAPNPRQAFEGFVAINPPRADVPVGALWIDEYGPSGEGADKDNLVTVRSLNGLTIDKNLQLSLNLGLLQLFGIDPKARDHYTARFTDLSLVQVKDVSKLAGIKGEPRIIEALKAGSVTISSDSEIGLNGQNMPWQRSAAQASGIADRTHTYAIEAHDMFIAIQVTTPELTRSKEQQLRIIDDGRSARLDDFLIVINRDQCPAAGLCRPRFGIMKINTQIPPNVEVSPLGASNELGLACRCRSRTGRAAFSPAPDCAGLRPVGKRRPRAADGSQGSAYIMKVRACTIWQSRRLGAGERHDQERHCPTGGRGALRGTWWQRGHAEVWGAEAWTGRCQRNARSPRPHAAPDLSTSGGLRVRRLVALGRPSGRREIISIRAIELRFT